MASHTHDVLWYKRSRVILVSICLFLVVGINICLVSKGFGHIDPRIAFWQAQQLWSEGQIVQAIPQFARAIWMAFEAGVRWSMADIHISRMRSLEKEGRLHEALQECARAVRILHGYDDEGGLSYECTAMEQRIIRLYHAPASWPNPGK